MGQSLVYSPTAASVLPQIQTAFSDATTTQLPGVASTWTDLLMADGTTVVQTTIAQTGAYLARVFLLAVGGSNGALMRARAIRVSDSLVLAQAGVEGASNTPTGETCEGSGEVRTLTAGDVIKVQINRSDTDANSLFWRPETGLLLQRVELLG